MIKDKPGEAIAAGTFQQMQTAQDRKKKDFRGIKRDLKVGQRVMVADYRKPNDRRWTEAVVIKKIGKTTFLCRLQQGNVWKRHLNQIKALGASMPRFAEGGGRMSDENKRDRLTYASAGMIGVPVDYLPDLCNAEIIISAQNETKPI